MIENGARWTFGNRCAHTTQGADRLPLLHAQQKTRGASDMPGGLWLSRCTHCDFRRPDGVDEAEAGASSGWSCASLEREERLETRDLAAEAGSGGRGEVGDAMEVMVAV